MRVLYLMCFSVLCFCLTFDVSISYGQSFVLPPDSVTSNNNYRARNSQKIRPAYTGGVVLTPQADSQSRGGYQRRRAYEAPRNENSNKTVSYGGRTKKKNEVKKRVRANSSGYRKNVRDYQRSQEEQAEFDRRTAHVNKIRAKSKAAYDKEMAPYIAQQKAERLKAERNKRSKKVRKRRL